MVVYVYVWLPWLQFVSQVSFLAGDYFEILEMRDMGLYEVPFSVSLLGFGIKSSFKHALEDLCISGAWCLVCQEHVSCYFYCVLFPVGSELCWV